MNKAIVALLFVAVVVFYSAVVLADDFMPPEFRGEPLTVTAGWDFSTQWTSGDIQSDYLTTIGDGGFHVLGSSFTHTHDVYTNLTWVPDPNDDTDGVLLAGPEGGQLGFFLVNWVDDYTFKHLWIQITYGGAGVPVVSSVVGPNADTNDWVDPTYGQPGDVGPFEFDATHRVEYWVLSPNPDREYVYIDLPPDTYVDQVVIDTISTPDIVPTDNRQWGEIKALYR